MNMSENIQEERASRLWYRDADGRRARESCRDMSGFWWPHRPAETENRRSLFSMQIATPSLWYILWNDIY